MVNCSFKTINAAEVLVTTAQVGDGNFKIGSLQEEEDGEDKEEEEEDCLSMFTYPCVSIYLPCLSICLSFHLSIYFLTICL